MEQNNKIMKFNDIREAFDYIVNKAWDNLTPEERKNLRDAKREFNHGSISIKRMQATIQDFGGQIKTEITLTV